MSTKPHPPGDLLVVEYTDSLRGVCQSPVEGYEYVKTEARRVTRGHRQVWRLTHHYQLTEEVQPNYRMGGRAT